MMFARTVLVLATCLIVSVFGRDASADELTDDFAVSPTTTGNWCEKDLSVRWQAAGYMAGMNADCCGIPAGEAEEVGGSTDCATPCETFFTGEPNFCDVCNITTNARGCEHLSISQGEFVGDERSVSIAFGFGVHLSPFPDSGCTEPENVKVVSAAHGACDARFEARVVRIGDPDLYKLDIRLVASPLAGHSECTALDEGSGAQLFNAGTSSTAAYELNLLSTRSATNPVSELQAVAEVVDIATGQVLASVSKSDFTRPSWYDRAGEGRRFAFGGARDALTGGTVFDDFAGTATPVPLDPNDPANPNGVSERDPTVAFDFLSSIEFLYSPEEPGEPTTQIDTQPGAIDPIRAAVLRGAVFGQDGAFVRTALAGVEVAVLGDAAVGRTHSRGDGQFDIVVNGGASVTLRFSKPGFLEVQRTLDVPIGDYVSVPDVVMTSEDPPAPLDLDNSTAFVAAQGPVEVDAAGTRRASILVAPGTTATVTPVDGSPQFDLSGVVSLRATEYTVGPNGRDAMPGELPPASAYTYAVELRIDEANGGHVTFDEPVYLYVENFVGIATPSALIPEAEKIPIGYYDRDRGIWIPSELDAPDDNGRLVTIVGYDGSGAAELDTDSDTQADNGSTIGVPIGLDERQRLGELYPSHVGLGLWRIPIDHFSAWDANMGFGPPPGAGDCGECAAGGDGDPGGGCGGGSIIGIERQTLGEIVGISGSPFRLHYSSDQVPGRIASRSLLVDLGTSAPLAVLPETVELEISVAGQMFSWSWPWAGIPSDPFLFDQWNGQDPYGREVLGRIPARIRVGYTFGSSYERVERFGYSGNGVQIGAARDGATVTLWRNLEASVENWDSRSVGLGGWTVDVHHTLDPQGRVLHLGTGSRRDLRDGPPVVETVAGGGGALADGVVATQASLSNPFDVDVAPDGTLFIAHASQIRSVEADGIIRRVAGLEGSGGWNGDGPADALTLSLNAPHGIAVASDGTIYIADRNNHRVRRVRDGQMETIAGSGLCGANCQFSSGFSGDGGPATASKLASPSDVAVGLDGSVYICDQGNARVRRIAPDGTVHTVAGGGTGFPDGIQAVDAAISPNSVEVGPEGELYISGGANLGIRLYRVDVDGAISIVAGNGVRAIPVPGTEATAASLVSPVHVAVSANSELFVTDYETLSAGNGRFIYRISSIGEIHEFAGVPGGGFSGDGGPPLAATFNLVRRTAFGPDGSFYVADQGNGRIRRIRGIEAVDSGPEILIPSSAGDRVFIFDQTGRHLRTVDAFTGTAIYAFGYSLDGRLSTITDRLGHVTSIVHPPVSTFPWPGDGMIVAEPGMQETDFTIGSNGYTSVLRNSADDVAQFVIGSGGLLTGLTDARGESWAFGYDALGRLIRDADPPALVADPLNGFYKALSRVDGPGGDFQVRVTTALGNASTRAVEHLPSDLVRRSTTAATGVTTEVLLPADGSVIANIPATPNGSTVQLDVSPDADRFGMLGSYVSSARVSLPNPPKLAAIDTVRSLEFGPSGTPFDVERASYTAILNNTSTFFVEYDATGANPEVRYTSPEGRAVDLVFDPATELLESFQVGAVDPVRLSYDPVTGRVSEARQGVGAEERAFSFGYNSEGLVDTITDPLLNTIDLTYNLAGLPDSVTFGGFSTALEWDENGNLTRVIPPYDTVVDRVEHELRFSSANLLDTYVPPTVPVATGNDTVWHYNRDRLIEKVTRPDGTEHIAQFETTPNPTGRVTDMLLPAGEQLAYSYDAVTGQVTSVAFSDGREVVYSYNGMLLSGMEWKSTAGGVDGAVAWEHSNSLNVQSRSVMSQSGTDVVTYQYDGEGNVTQAGALAITRDDATGLLTGHVDSTELGGPSGVSDEWKYSSFGGLESYDAEWSGASVFRQEYVRDKLGRIVEILETLDGAPTLTSHRRYEYDGRNSLWRVYDELAGGQLEAEYTYDNRGNRKTGPGSVLPATYDDQDRVVAYGDLTFSFSDNGELTQSVDASDGTTIDFGYDTYGNLERVTTSGATIEYIYDPMQRRVGRRVNGTLDRMFLYEDQLRVAAELDGSGALVSRFVYGTKTNVPDYMIRGGSVYRILSDHVGSVRRVVNVATGAVVLDRAFDEFGRVISESGQLDFVPFGFAGGLFDGDYPDPGHVRFGYRDYLPTLGRWMSRDPLLFAGGQGNLYLYAYNDPVNATDEWGLVCPPFPPSATMACIGAISGFVGGVVGTVVAQSANGKIDPVEIVVVALAGAAAGATVGATTGAINPSAVVVAAIAVGTSAGVAAGTGSSYGQIAGAALAAGIAAGISGGANATGQIAAAGLGAAVGAAGGAGIDDALKADPPKPDGDGENAAGQDPTKPSPGKPGDPGAGGACPSAPGGMSGENGTCELAA